MKTENKNSLKVVQAIFMLSELVDLQRVQSVGMVSDYNFRVTLVSGVEAFGKPEQYKDFLEKYMTYLESKQ